MKQEIRSFTMNEFLEKAVREEKIDEGEEKIDEGRGSQGLESVIDDFVRFLIGDRNVALNGLKKMAKSKFMDDYIPEPGKDYNNLYAELFADISKAIKKNTLWG